MSSPATMPRTQIRVHIRWMIRRDMPEVLEIEQASTEHPWSEEEFLRRLRERNCIGMVAERGEQIVGFMVYEFRRREILITNFAVHPRFRRHGVGRQMAEKLISKLDGVRRRDLRMFVRETALTAQLFFRACGFIATEIVHEKYDDTGEDAYAMRYRLGEQGTQKE